MAYAAATPAGHGGAEIMIDPAGNVIRTTHVQENSNLPYLLGADRDLLIQPLSDENETTWKQKRVISIFDKKPEQRSNQWPPPPPWARQQQQPTDGTVRTAHEAVTFTITSQDATQAKIQRKYELTSDEKVGDNPTLKETGEGEIVFDKARGLITSIDWKMNIEVNQKNITARIPVTVTARLLKPQEVAKAKADREAALAKAKDDAEKHRTEEELREKFSNLPKEPPRLRWSAGMVADRLRVPIPITSRSSDSSSSWPTGAARNAFATSIRFMQNRPTSQPAIGKSLSWPSRTMRWAV